jgi:hypothetical protein
MKRVENVEQMEVDQGMRKKLKTQESEKKFVRSCASCSRVPCEGRRIMASALWKLRDLTADVQVYANDKSMTLVHCSILDSQLPRLVAQSFGGRKRLRRFDLDLPKNVVVDWLRAAYWMRDIDDGPTRDTMITLATVFGQSNLAHHLRGYPLPGQSLDHVEPLFNRIVRSLRVFLLDCSKPPHVANVELYHLVLSYESGWAQASLVRHQCGVDPLSGLPAVCQCSTDHPSGLLCLGDVHHGSR